VSGLHKIIRTHTSTCITILPRISSVDRELAYSDQHCTRV